MADLTLNILGCGRLGKTLGRLWTASGVFAIHDVLNRSLKRSESAVAFLGAGRAVGRVAEMRPADVWMLAVPDDQIVGSCMALAESGKLAAGNVVFHCSGALSSSELAAAAARGASVASIHPLKSFADPAAAVWSFSGTCCAAEGDIAAIAKLRPAFERVGAAVIEIDRHSKMIYHAASVIAGNYLVAIVETGLRCFERSGFPRATAQSMIEPLVRETLDNVLKLGTVDALTGPVTRGDATVVSRHIDALAGWDPRIAAIYRQLGTILVDLARAQGKADAGGLEAIERLFAEKDH